MLTVSEVVIQRLLKYDINSAFGVVGGAIMFLTEAIRKADQLNTTFVHHEQSAAIAAEAFGKLNNNPAIVFATAGPGVTNVITGIADAFMDSVPLVLLVGDVRTTLAADFKNQRYNAPQEVDQKSLLSPIVKKYLNLNMDISGPQLVAYVDEMVSLSVSGRMGPVCISIPLDVQGKLVEESCLNVPIKQNNRYSSDCLLTKSICEVIKKLRTSQRPVLLLGAGVRQSDSLALLETLIKKYCLPYCVTIGAVDLQNKNDQLSIGCIGPTSQRAANMIVQSADLILAIGTSLDQSVTGFNIDRFFEKKELILVNIDKGEFVRLNAQSLTSVEADAQNFCQILLNELNDFRTKDDWIGNIKSIKSVISFESESKSRSLINNGFNCAYKISNKISQNLPENAVVVLGISLDAHSVFNAFEVTKGQRVIVSRNLGPMGWDLPAVIGAAKFAQSNQPIVLITGDGSVMLNLQELSVIAGLHLPVCIFIFNNAGYTSIRTTQSNFFDAKFIGCGIESGLHIPDFSKVSKAFGINYQKLNQLSEIDEILTNHINHPQPTIVECMIDPKQLREPRLVSRLENGKFYTPGLDDMYPPMPDSILDAINKTITLIN